ncbi:MAG: PDZ domain-containing protein [Opitutaceae bacterium]|jgi:hypothetical protein|nr:PDZ domain-containing protein [Opitutaceae bacterium]
MKPPTALTTFTARLLALAALHSALALAAAADPADAFTLPLPPPPELPSLPAPPAAPAPALSLGEVPGALRAAFVRIDADLQSSAGENASSTLAPDLRAERSTITGGYLVAPDLVIAPDFNIPPRFVRAWRAVQEIANTGTTSNTYPVSGTPPSLRTKKKAGPASSAGNRGTGATTTTRPIAWAADRNAMLLKLARPAPRGRPLEFAPAENIAPSSCFSVKYTADLGNRAIIESLSQPRWQVSPDGTRTRRVPANSIIATDAGAPLALALSDALPPDATWKTPWRDWPWIYENDLKARHEKLTAATESALIHADLKMRPLPVRTGENPFSSITRPSAADPSAKPHPAIVLSPRRVLVLATLSAADTARLENVTLRLPGDTRVPARFIASVAAHGAFVAEPEHDIEAPLALPATEPDWPALRDRLLLTIDLRLQGETRLARPGITRILSVGYGVSDATGANITTPRPADPSNTLFLFDLDGNLLGCPLRPRSTNTDDNTYITRSSSSTRAQIISASALAEYATDPGDWSDTTNIPLTETEERQLVWLGVDLQPLTRELAQAQGVAEQTQNGNSGGLVTNVYPASPAERAGLQPGDVLLRMRRANSPANIAIRAGNNSSFSMQMFSRPDLQIPDSAYDRLPPPWPLADNPLNRKLKEIGAGKPLELDYARDGDFSTVSLTAEKGPSYYGTAPESIFAASGLNVKALTFETRAFYKIPDANSALIVSRVVAGSRASVAGLRPYDLIIEVNDQPVTTPDAFSEFAKTGGNLRLLTRRMSQTRIVTLDLDAAE